MATRAFLLEALLVALAVPGALVVLLDAAEGAQLALP